MGNRGGFGVVTLAAAMIMASLGACVSRTPTTPGGPATRAGEEATLARQIRSMTMAYPTARITAVVFSEDLELACGRIVAPGKPDMVFVSMDLKPGDGDRPLMMPFLIDPGSWEVPGNRELSDSALRRCQRLGLFPDPTGSPQQ